MMIPQLLPIERRYSHDLTHSSITTRTSYIYAQENTMLRHLTTVCRLKCNVLTPAQLFYYKSQLYSMDALILR